MFRLWIFVFCVQNDFLIEVFGQNWSYPHCHFYALLYPVQWLLSCLSDTKRKNFLLKILNSLKIILYIDFNFCSWSLFLKCRELLFLSLLWFMLQIVRFLLFFIILMILSYLSINRIFLIIFQFNFFWL